MPQHDEPLGWDGREEIPHQAYVREKSSDTAVMSFRTIKGDNRWTCELEIAEPAATVQEGWLGCYIRIQPEPAGGCVFTGLRAIANLPKGCVAIDMMHHDLRGTTLADDNLVFIEGKHAVEDEPGIGHLELIKKEKEATAPAT